MKYLSSFMLVETGIVCLKPFFHAVAKSDGANVSSLSLHDMLFFPANEYDRLMS